MKTIDSKTLNAIVKHFIDLYADELHEVTPDCIYEWWSLTSDQYNIDRGDDEIYDEIERAIFKKINSL